MWFSNLEAVNRWNTLTCSDTTLWAETMYYQENDFIGYSHIQNLVPKFKWFNKHIANIIIASSRISTEKKYDYWNKFNREAMNKTEIQLPTKNWKIDFDFMENFIEELEKEKIERLEKYLEENWLKNCELTSEEKKVLEDFENGKIEWWEFRIEDVLDWQKQKEIDPLKLEFLKDESEKMYPFYGQSTTNNGIISYNQLKSEVINNKNAKPTILIHSNNQNIVYLETPFSLKDWHWATSVLQSEELNKINQMFIVSSIDKVIKIKYSYNNKATKIELKNSIISLPIKNNNPDYGVMEILISGVQKMVVKSVVEYVEGKV